VGAVRAARSGGSDPRGHGPLPEGSSTTEPGIGAMPGPASVRVTFAGDPPLVMDVDPGADPEPPGPGDPPGAAPAGASSMAAGRALVRALPAVAGQAPGAVRVEVVVDGWRFEAELEPARRAALRDLARREHAAAGGGRRVVRAPLPGRIVRTWVSVGDHVEAGARLCSLEAMKMENEILAGGAGTIERVSVAPGARVEQGDELVVIA
jgi:glutaconyl-CoA/methylmalonyl-CoA decarboxylase subunit gamma